MKPKSEFWEKIFYCIHLRFRISTEETHGSAAIINNLQTKEFFLLSPKCFSVARFYFWKGRIIYHVKCKVYRGHKSFLFYNRCIRIQSLHRIHDCVLWAKLEKTVDLVTNIIEE
jgi:hypothetical protein